MGTPVNAISWEDKKRRARFAGGAAILSVAVAVGFTASHAPVVASSAPLSVIVRAASGRMAAVDQAVVRSGGRVTGHLGLVNGAVATIPASRVAVLESSPGVVQVTPNIPVHLLASSYDPTTDLGSAYETAKLAGVQEAWNQGFTGDGIDVALIDSGVAPVPGLTGQVINGPDLSLEAGAPNLAYNDTYGHGTFMAGIIAGNDQPQAQASQYAKQPQNFAGIAPDARIVSLKVADAHGNTDISQVIAAIDWVVEHRDDPAMHLHIRVLNLSFGTDSTQSYTVDPLAFAVEQAWSSGIVVVAAAGNQGNGTTTLLDPAYDPYVIAVGAADPNGHSDVKQFGVAAFSNGSTGGRVPDILAPGVHIVSLRDPGSFVDTTYGSTGLVTSRFFRGSGTSEATAVVSGAVADLLEKHPEFNPDQVKNALMQTAKNVHGAPSLQGQGELSLHDALGKNIDPKAVQKFPPSSGTGNLDGSRGSNVLSDNGVALKGNIDIFGNALDPAALAQAEASGTAWNGGSFMGDSWTGGGWVADAWQRSSWSTGTWSASDWAGQVWQRSSWSSTSWSTAGWTRSSWSGGSWDGDDWARSSWSGDGWASDIWS